MIKRSKCILWFMIKRRIKRFALCSHPQKQTARFRHLSYDQPKEHLSPLLASSFLSSKTICIIAWICFYDQPKEHLSPLHFVLKNKLHNCMNLFFFILFIFPCSCRTILICYDQTKEHLNALLASSFIASKCTMPCIMIKRRNIWLLCLHPHFFPQK